MSYYLRPLIKTKGEFHLAERLSRLVWGPQSADLAHVMIASAEAGGVVLGAFLPSGKLVGFCQSFPAYKDGKAWLYSHSVAVHPDYRAQGIATGLKTQQREEALKRGFDLITWTFDPLESANANVNLRRLGGRIMSYEEDYYGPMGDRLNAELPSDRVTCSWELKSPAVIQRLAGGYRPPYTPSPPHISEETAAHPPGRSTRRAARPASAAFVNTISFDRDLPQSRLLYPPHTTGVERLYIAIPTTFQKLKTASHRLALEWRLSVRQYMQALFLQGYVGTDFNVVNDDPQPIGVYTFEKPEESRSQ